MRIVVCIVVVSFIFTSCKKDKKSGNDTQASQGNSNVRSRFVDTVMNDPDIASLFVSVDNTNNFYLISGNIAGTYKLTKFDQEINVAYTKQIHLTGKLIDMCSQNAGSFYVLSATNNSPYKATGAPVNAYILEAPANSDSTVFCGGPYNPLSYQYTPLFDTYTVLTGQNHSELKRFNSEGDVVWSRTLDGAYFSGNAIETDAHGNIYVLTLTMLRGEPRHTYANGVSPYFLIRSDSNSFSLHKFDASGNLLFKKTILNVYDSGETLFNLALSDNSAYVCNGSNLFTFDLQGNNVSRTKPLLNGCMNHINSVVSNPFIHNVIVTGNVYSAPIQSKYFVELNGQQASHTTLYSFLYPEILSAVDREENAYGMLGNFLCKISASGELVYKKYLLTGQQIFGLNKLVIDCTGQLYGFSNDNGLIKVYKFDKKGDFN